MKPLSTSIYTFEKLRDEGFLYVDKTAVIFDLVAKTQQYFLSRPRRFGKSLLVSTLKAIFQGRRDLFEGLALAGKNYDWQTYPVIHLDMGTTAASDPGGLFFFSAGMALNASSDGRKRESCDFRRPDTEGEGGGFVREAPSECGRLAIEGLPPCTRCMG